ncbi:hypothetical protein B0H63DRAFT_88736 [Podospora didyma]|uniref:Uncharacterized protein n=1 Tax=Podospora didyma TaxID=330526 RepID=A0AAE0K0Y9_9PEZI|nr:hypothetical protein B0H63DRAFT_88736 [Podospora didyma]
MDLQNEIEKIQNDLIDLKARLDAFEAKSKSTIQEDHSNMLAQLQSSVDSVERTVLYLETGTSRLVGYIEYKKPASGTNDVAASKAIAKRHLMDMDANFSLLHQAASSGLERVEDIKKTGDDMHDELCAIRTKIESVSTRTRSALTTANKNITDKQKQLSEANQSLASTRQELSTLEAKMASEKEDRNVMRVARAATWGISIFFPPALLVAGGLEAAAFAMRKDRERLQDSISSATTRKSSLQSEVSTLESQKKSLDKAVTSARALLQRAETMDMGSQEIKTLIQERLVEYQNLKESTDEFSAWTHDLKDQTATMKALGPSQEAMLRSTTKRIVDALLEKDHSDVKMICGKLKRLEIAASGVAPKTRKRG